jgi:DNA uptake protein ComE-like DNA-binding protein
VSGIGEKLAENIVLYDLKMVLLKIEQLKKVPRLGEKRISRSHSHFEC